jgi:hypothetical protein
MIDGVNKEIERLVQMTEVIHIRMSIRLTCLLQGKKKNRTRVIASA